MCLLKTRVALPNRAGINGKTIVKYIRTPHQQQRCHQVVPTEHPVQANPANSSAVECTFGEGRSQLIPVLLGSGLG
jgi:hypothetical protein